MKLVKEHIILEKFTLDSDPIHDMGIGMIYQIKKFIEESSDTYYREIYNIDDYLWICAEHEKIDYIKFLVEYGVNIHRLGDRALRWAAKRGNCEIAKYLLDNGADVNAYTGGALELAKDNADKKMEKLLRKYGAKDRDPAQSWPVNEKFIEDSDPIHDMGIGIKHKIEEWLDNIKNVEMRSTDGSRTEKSYYKINDDLTIDVYGDLVISGKLLVKLPDYIQFRTVHGTCWFNYNKNLITLKGGPIYVKKWFCCNNNKLSSLKYAPKEVGDDFFCEDNVRKFTKKYVRKYTNVRKRIIIVINEGFVEDSDPIHDMGIGIDVILKNCIKKIYRRDASNIEFEYQKSFPKKEWVRDDGKIIRFIHITNEGSKFVINLYSNMFRDKNKKLINKCKYAKELLKYADILSCMKSKIKYTHDIYTTDEVTFYIEPSYHSKFLKLDTNPYH
jgi:hypothetical protein